MKCPHCKRSIALFSRALNDWKNEKRCPYCGDKVEIYINIKMLTLLFVPAMVVALALKGKLGIFGFGLASLLIAVFSMRLRPATKK